MTCQSNTLLFDSSNLLNHTKVLKYTTFTWFLHLHQIMYSWREHRETKRMSVKITDERRNTKSGCCWVDGLGNRTSPFLATSAMMLATLGLQEDWGFSRVGSRGRTPISWIFTLASVSEEEKQNQFQYH